MHRFPTLVYPCLACFYPATQPSSKVGGAQPNHRYC